MTPANEIYPTFWDHSTRLLEGVDADGADRILVAQAYRRLVDPALITVARLVEMGFVRHEDPYIHYTYGDMLSVIEYEDGHMSWTVHVTPDDSFSLGAWTQPTTVGELNGLTDRLKRNASVHGDWVARGKLQKKLRRAAKRNLVEESKLCGLDIVTLSRMERGELEPHVPAAPVAPRKKRVTVPGG